MNFVKSANPEKDNALSKSFSINSGANISKFPKKVVFKILNLCKTFPPVQNSKCNNLKKNVLLFRSEAIVYFR